MDRFSWNHFNRPRSGFLSVITAPIAVLWTARWSNQFLYRHVDYAPRRNGEAHHGCLGHDRCDRRLANRKSNCWVLVTRPKAAKAGSCRNGLPKRSKDFSPEDKRAPPATCRRRPSPQCQICLIHFPSASGMLVVTVMSFFGGVDRHTFGSAHTQTLYLPVKM
jgi:hypothetical protein